MRNIERQDTRENSIPLQDVGSQLSSSLTHEHMGSSSEPIEPSLIQIQKARDPKQKIRRNKNNQVQYFALFKYATKNEYFCIVVAIFLSLGIGALFPCFCILFGELLQYLTNMVVEIGNQDVPGLLAQIQDVNWANLALEIILRPEAVKDAVAAALQLVQLLVDIMAAFDYLDERVIRMAIILVIMGALGFVAAFFQKVLTSHYAHSMMMRIRRKYIESALRQDMSFHDKHNGGELIAYITSDMTKIEEAVGDNLQFFFLLWGVVICGLAVGFAFDWKLALVCLAFVPLIAGSGAIMSRVISRSSSKSSTEYARGAGMAEEALALIRTVTSFGSQKFEADRFEERMEVVCKKGIIRNVILGTGVGVSLFILFGSCAFIMWYSFELVKNGELGVGDAMTVFYAIVLSAIALGQIFSCLEKVSQARGAAYQIYFIIDHEPIIDNLSDAGIIPERELSGEMKFENLFFNYPGYDKTVLNDFSLTLKQGKSVALVGFSGSGKSTTLQLVERFYLPNSGSISVDGYDISDLNIRWYRSQIGYVGQEPELFSGTFRENIAMGAPLIPNPDYNPDEPQDIYLNPRLIQKQMTQNDIERAAEMANAHDFICSMPLQYDTLIGEGGGNLSGGEKQRIAIARSLLRNPNILLLDEATSALDSKSEKIVQKALDEASKGRMTIIIAHRLSSVRQADTIVFMKNGSIVEMGSHDELMSRNGAYKDFVFIQENKEGEEQSQPQQHQQVMIDDNADFSELSFSRSKSMESGTTTTSSGSDPDFHIKTQTAAPLQSVVSFSKKKERSLSPTATAPLRSIDTADNTLDEDEILDQIIEDEESELRRLNDRKSKKVKQIDSGLFWKTLKFQKSEWHLLLIGIIAAIFSGVTWPLFAFAFGEMMDVFITLDESASMKWVWTFFILACVSFVSNLTMYSAIGGASEKLTKRLRDKTFKALMKQEIGFFDDPQNSVSVLSVHLSTDAASVSGLTGGLMAMQAMLWTTIVTSVTIAFISCVPLAGLMFTSIPIIGIVAAIGMWWSGKIEKNAIKSTDAATRVANEYLSSVKTVTYLGVGEDVCSTYNTLIKEPKRAFFKSSLIAGFTFGFTQFIVLSVWGIAFWFGVQLVKEDFTCTVKGMITTFSAVIFGTFGLAFAVAVSPDLRAGRIGATRIFRLLKRHPEISLESDGKVQFDDDDGVSEYSVQTEKSDKVSASGNLIVKDVVFSYPTRPQKRILDKFSVEIPGGKTLALVGESGCGKSSLLGLIQQFYLFRAGSIKLDGCDISNIDIKSLRAMIGYVGQEPDLFTGTVRENILYGLIGTNIAMVTEEKLQDACEKSNSWDFICDLPQGLDTHLGIRGSLLSGGQKQRIAIARALIRNPKILLLDEATSALDAQSERIVQAALDKACIDRTTIVIAHRLKVIYNAHKIAYVQKGQVAEQGTHEELMSIDNGLYRKLVQMQH